ncbi:MAG: hypothetical protein WD894_20260 [Pirellulales bacterium]
MTLLDQFACQAMAALLTIGTNQPSEHLPRNGKPFEHPDAPYYFGNWEPSNKPDKIIGVDSLACDAYMVAQAMMRERQRLCADKGEGR